MKRSELRQIIREEVRHVLMEQQFTLRDLENHIYDNRDDIADNMKTYGWKIRDVVKIDNYRDLATLLGVDARLLKDVDIEEYATTTASLL